MRNWLIPCQGQEGLSTQYEAIMQPLVARFGWPSCDLPAGSKDPQDSGS